MDTEENESGKRCAFLMKACDSTCAAYAAERGGETNCHRLEASIHSAIGMMRIALHFDEMDEENRKPCMCPECAAESENGVVEAKKKANTVDAVGGGMYR